MGYGLHVRILLQSQKWGLYTRGRGIIHETLLFYCQGFVSLLEGTLKTKFIYTLEDLFSNDSRNENNQSLMALIKKWTGNETLMKFTELIIFDQSLYYQEGEGCDVMEHMDMGDGKHARKKRQMRQGGGMGKGGMGKGGMDMGGTDMGGMGMGGNLA